MLAGFSYQRFSALAAKAALLVGLAFNISCTFIFMVDFHFIHIWGIEFVLNMTVMDVISYYISKGKPFKIKDFKS